MMKVELMSLLELDAVDPLLGLNSENKCVLNCVGALKCASK
jgi:hypothetical protein